MKYVHVRRVFAVSQIRLNTAKYNANVLDGLDPMSGCTATVIQLYVHDMFK